MQDRRIRKTVRSLHACVPPQDRHIGHMPRRAIRLHDPRRPGRQIAADIRIQWIPLMCTASQDYLRRIRDPVRRPVAPATSMPEPRSHLQVAVF